MPKPPGATAAVLPPLSTDQRRAALAKAVHARRVRAELCASLKRGQLSLAEVLDRADRDDEVAGIRVLTLIEGLPRFGRTRALDAMERLRIAPTRRLRGLGGRQRAALRELDAR